MRVFFDYTIIEKENLIMKELIYFLQSLGGMASKKDLLQTIRDQSKMIPMDYFDEVKKSANTGKTYKPSDFQVNFSIKHLNLAGYLSTPSRGMIELTEKGRQLDLKNFDPVRDVRSISEPIFQANSKNKKKRTKTATESKEQPSDQQSVVMEETVEEKADSWRLQLSEALDAMSPKRFELFARRLVKSMGVELDDKIGLSYTNDGGLDGFGYIQSGDFRTARVAIQAKRWQGNVSSPEIDKFRGAMDKFNAEFGIFITTSNFTKGAIEVSRIGTRVITLINGEDIADIVAEKKLYVKEVITYELEDFYYEED